MFNNRRQSRDRVVNADVVKTAEGHKLRIAPFSLKLFENSYSELLVDENFLDLAGEDDYCFVENRALLPYWEKIKEITIYRWNRRYPYDLRFDVDLNDTDFRLYKTEELEGYSHEKIIKEVYRK